MNNRTIFKGSVFIIFIAAAIFLVYANSDTAAPEDISEVLQSSSTEKIEVDSTATTSEASETAPEETAIETSAETEAKDEDVIQEQKTQPPSAETTSQEPVQRPAADNAASQQPPEKEVEAESVSETPPEPESAEEAIVNNTVTTSSGQTYTYSQKLDMRATAYTYTGTELDITASGRPVQVGVVSADFSVIPMNTEVYIVAADGSWEYGYAIVGDTGVKGNTIDVFLETEEACINFGVRNAIVYILE